MWFDKYPGVPPRGSPLETVFLLVHLGRKEAEMLSTRALVRGQFAAMARSESSAKTAYEAYVAYEEAMFPFIEQATNTFNQDHQRLMEHVAHPMQIDVASIMKERAHADRLKGLRKFQARAKS
jgi:hypothetical protein